MGCEEIPKIGEGIFEDNKICDLVALFEKNNNNNHAIENLSFGCGLCIK